ncbi:TRAP transporter substrate-binding protein DctP [uncultured Cohaesibacter sp.]|uniref:TRAP transporter substrate-binding protein n=1 Tax=uncultured Cohaesibacter sp. TaxID=1002546 RepID=UPI0029C824CF|nr:TRAP transporter substrate-binding protein DctP [uncultured Cohaesibacter sp.]
MLRKVSAALCATAVIALAGFNGANAQDTKMTFGITAPVEDNGFSYTPFEVLVREIEGRSAGSIDVDFFPGGQLGNVESTINATMDGVMQASSAADGAITSIFPELQVLSIPYIFAGREVAWDVLDGPFGQKLSDLMAEKTGLRPLGWYENGGYRHYSSAKKELKTVEDLAGLKMRTMSHPMHMQIAKSLGMSPTPVPWGELYISLQSGVVDGQENAIPTFLVPKLEEVQKNMILDGHVYATTTVVVNEGWYQSLSEEQRAILKQATDIAVGTSRGLSVSGELIGRTYLEKSGVKVNDVSATEKAKFRDKAQGPAIEWLRGQIDGALIDDLLAEVAKSEAKFGY